MMSLLLVISLPILEILNKDLLLEETLLLEMDGLLDIKSILLMLLWLILSLLTEMLNLEVELFTQMDPTIQPLLLKKICSLEDHSLDQVI